MEGFSFGSDEGLLLFGRTVEGVELGDFVGSNDGTEIDMREGTILGCKVGVPLGADEGVLVVGTKEGS